jgi:Abnormal spindle-like microcephaly-assoc'd, ASPM-SPD-2-Hydin/Protein of unknown function (DUF1573)
MINQRNTPIQASPAGNLRLRHVSSKRHNPFIFIALAAALLVSLTQVGCTGLTSANAAAPADPTNATTIAIVGATGSFGSVATGTSVTQTFTVANTGSATLTITQLAASGSGFSVSGFTLPITVNPGQGTSFVAKFAPTTAGAVTGSISMTANTNPAVSTIALSGTGTGSSQSAISVSPSSFDFANIAMGTTTSHSFTISNTGGATLSVTSLAAAGPGFSVSGFSLPISVGANQSTTINATFAPTAVGPVGGTLTIANNSPTPSMVVALEGTGTGQAQPTISVSPASFDFGNVAVSVASSHTFTISNTSSTALSISNIAAAGSGFTVSGFTLPVSVPANQSTTISAKFLPTAAGAVGGSITITNNSATPSVVVALNGTGVAAGQPVLSVNPTSVSFGNVTVGAPNSQAILVQNTGTATLTISQATATGTGFSISGITTPATIASGGSTTFSVAFAPTSGGAASGSISLVSNAAGSPLAIPLSGTGVASTLLLGASASSLTFPSVAVGSNSSQSVTLTNNGNSTVTIETVSSTGAGFSASGVAAGQMIAAGQTATLNVAFAPASAAMVSGTVTVTSNATNSPINISLSGTGTQTVAHSVSLSWTASTSNVVGYNVYRSTTSGGPYTLITSASVTGTTYTDSSVQAGVTYFYVVTAVDSNGNESAFSNEASVAVPTP